jgi:hypothetical protein
VRIRLKGINSITKKLADGTRRTYYYAWKGGPPLRGKPGSPEFVASYNEAVARKVVPPRGTLLSVLQGYQASEDFLGLAPRSRSDYVGKIKLIEKAFGDFPLAALTDNRTRGIFKAWRERLAVSSRRQADYAWVVLARVLSWGMDRGLVAVNPCKKGGRLYRGSRAEKIWTPADEAAFLERTRASAPAVAAGAVDWTAARRPLAPAVVGLRRNAYPPAAVERRSARRHSGGHTAQVRARRRAQAQHDHAYHHGRQAVDTGRLPRVMGQGVQARGRSRRHVSRFARYRRHPAGDCRLHRGGDRHHHRTLDAQRARNHRHALFERDPVLAESAIRKLETRTKAPN